MDRELLADARIRIEKDARLLVEQAARFQRDEESFSVSREVGLFSVEINTADQSLSIPLVDSDGQWNYRLGLIEAISTAIEEAHREYHARRVLNQEVDR